MISPRGPLAVRRITADLTVLASAALMILIAAATAATLTVFTVGVLPQVVRHDLVSAPGTALAVSTLASTPGQVTADGAALRTRIAATTPGIPFRLQQAQWSDPLGLVPGALPAPPGGSLAGATLLQAASMSVIDGHASLVAGRWPAAPADGRGQAIPAALPASAAALLHVCPGDVLRLHDQVTGAVVSFTVTGLFTRRPSAGPDDSYWKLSYLPASGESASYGSTTYGPLVVNQAALGPALTMLSASWVAQPDMAAFGPGDLRPASASVAALTRSLPGSTSLSGAQLVTGLASVLAGAASNLAVARSELAVGALELLVLAVAALLAAARLLAAQREAQTELLIARGATRAQLTGLTAAEVIPLSALVSVAGAVAGVRLAGLLAATGPLAAAGVRLAGQGGTWSGALGAAGAVTVIAAAALLSPGLTLGPAAARVRRGRQARVTGMARAGLDLALAALAGLAAWQLRHYSAASGPAGFDPVLALAPALALAAGGAATLRLLPLAARAADRLAARGRRLTAPLASWQFSRMPVRQGGAALLLTLAVATGTLALAQHASWLRSASDQAAFATGGDVQVDLPVPLAAGAVGAVAGARGVTQALAVTDSQASSGDVLAVGADQAAQVVRLRRDQSALPSGALFGTITPASGLPGTGLTATRAGTIQLTAALGPAAAAPAGPATQFGPATVTLTVLDQAGAAYQVPAGTLSADGRSRRLTASLGGDRARYPLRLDAVTVAFPLPPHRDPRLSLTLGGLSLGGLSLAGWTEEASAPGPDSLPPGSVTQPQGGPVRGAGGATTFTFSAGQAPAPGAGAPRASGQLLLLPRMAPVTAIPAIATRAFVNANDTPVGSVVPEFLGGAQVPLRIVAEVSSFPTVTAPGGALVADLGRLQEYLARQSLPPLAVTQWWLATAGGGVPPSLAAALPAGGSASSATARAAAATGGTLSAAPQQALLALAAAAALLAATGFWVSIAADVRRRRSETALLAALGVTRRAAARLLCLEKLLLSLPAVALGVLLGSFVAWLLVPAVTLTPAAGQPVPPAVAVYQLSQALALAAVVAVLPAVAAALAAARRPDPAAELRAAEAA